MEKIERNCLCACLAFASCFAFGRNGNRAKPSELNKMRFARAHAFAHSKSGFSFAKLKIVSFFFFRLFSL